MAFPAIEQMENFSEYLKSHIMSLLCKMFSGRSKMVDP